MTEAITTDEVFRWAARAGLTPAEARQTLVRDLLLWTQARERSERAEWRRALSIVNTISGIVGGETFTIDDLYEEATPQKSDGEEIEAMKGRNMSWLSSKVTDF